jgi:hypothetical protein
MIYGHGVYIFIDPISLVILIAIFIIKGNLFV